MNQTNDNEYGGAGDDDDDGGDDAFTVLVDGFLKYCRNKTERDFIHEAIKENTE